MIVSTTIPTKIQAYCKEGLKHRLHFTHGSGQQWMYKNPELIKAIAIKYKKGKPIGMAVVLHKKDYEMGVNFGIYVRQKHRKQGVGTELFRRLRYRLLRDSFIVSRWDNASTMFYNKVQN